MVKGEKQRGEGHQRMIPEIVDVVGTGLTEANIFVLDVGVQVELGETFAEPEWRSRELLRIAKSGCTRDRRWQRGAPAGSRDARGCNCCRACGERGRRAPTGFSQDKRSGSRALKPFLSLRARTMMGDEASLIPRGRMVLKNDRMRSNSKAMWCACLSEVSVVTDEVIAADFGPVRGGLRRSGADEYQREAQTKQDECA